MVLSPLGAGADSWKSPHFPRSLSLALIPVALLIQVAQGACGGSEYSAKFSAIDVVCHLGSLIETVAFLQHNMLVLRLLEMTSAAMLAVYSFIHTKNGTDCHFMWYFVHFAVNSYHVLMYLRAYMSINFTETEARLSKGLFNIYSRAQFGELKRHYQCRTVPPGTDLMSEGCDVKEMLLLTSGSVEVIKHGEILDTLHTDLIGPQFFGEMSYFTMQQASATIRVWSEDAEVIAWNMEHMRHLCSSSGHSLVEITFRQLPALFATQLAHRANQVAASLSKYKHSEQSDVQRTLSGSPQEGKGVKKLFRDIVLMRRGKSRFLGDRAPQGGNRPSLHTGLKSPSSSSAVAPLSPPPTNPAPPDPSSGSSSPVQASATQGSRISPPAFLPGRPDSPQGAPQLVGNPRLSEMSQISRGTSKGGWTSERTDASHGVHHDAFHRPPANWLPGAFPSERSKDGGGVAAVATTTSPKAHEPGKPQGFDESDMVVSAFEIPDTPSRDPDMEGSAAEVESEV